MTGSNRYMQRMLINYSNDSLRNIYRKDDELYNTNFLSIAYDNTVGNSWRTVVESPFTKNATEEQLEYALQLLHKYKVDRKLLILHISNSKQFKQNG